MQTECRRTSELSKCFRYQAHVEDIQAYEQEEEHRYHSDLRQFSSSFSYFHMNKDINDTCVDSSYQFTDFSMIIYFQWIIVEIS